MSCSREEIEDLQKMEELVKSGFAKNYPSRPSKADVDELLTKKVEYEAREGGMDNRLVEECDALIGDYWVELAKTFRDEVEGDAWKM
ncbi:hypothetical protein V5O48_014313 [Marasmius crinis-equi]|uniref:Uncharacterized protein n=1 Tax=Marasmius crinis-equi TaxID=585013 RepID=A0ABR3EXM4_9AGAR